MTLHICDMCDVIHFKLSHDNSEHILVNCAFCCEVFHKAFRMWISHIAGQCLHNGDHLYYCYVCNNTLFEE